MKLANILLVEESDGDAALFQEFIARQRLCNKVTWVKSYRDALLHFQQGEEFDLLVIDLLPPGEGGLELIESLQTIPKYRDVPVIVMSGIEEDKKIDTTAQQAANLGALAYIVKPLSFEKWWPVIQELKKLHIGLMVEAA